MKNLCGCKHAKVENDGGNSYTWFYVCKLSGKATDPKRCSFCPLKEEEV